MLTGTFKNIITFTIIIFVHELGHFLTAVALGWKVDKIVIYPYGGCTKFSDCLNKSIISEFIILVMGPLTQICFYFFVSKYLNTYDLLLFQRYNFAIFFFNLLPIYPLDGGRFINLLFNKMFPYFKSLTLSIYFSLIVFFIVLLIYKTPTYYLILFFLLTKVYDEFKNRKFYYNKFLLERYLYKFNFKNTKIINNVNCFFRDKKHIIKDKNNYYKESDYLKKYFKI